MGNLGETIKRFVGNKNTVTILAVIAGIIVLWYFYNYRVNQAITTIQVPYSISGVDSSKKIDTSDVGYKDLTQSTLKNNDIVTNITALDGKYICTGDSVAANDFFYESQLCDKKELKNFIYDELADDEKLYTLSVDFKDTYADSIMPGDYIDLYLRATDDNDKVIFGPLIESIRVLAVRDSSGRDLFWDSEAGNTAALLFGVSDNLHKLLNVAEDISGYSIKIIPVPRSSSYTANPGETRMVSDELYNFIMSKSASIAGQ